MMPDTTHNDNTAKGLKLFRGAQAPPLAVTDYRGVTPVVADGLERMAQSGISQGVDVRVLFEAPGFSLTYAWFKSGFPLPAHFHEADCLYYIAAGSLQIGNETLGKGDGFFVPASTPYSYTPGSEGVEVIEMRHHGCTDIEFIIKTPAYWDRAVARTQARSAAWQEEGKP